MDKTTKYLEEKIKKLEETQVDSFAMKCIKGATIQNFKEALRLHKEDMIAQSNQGNYHGYQYA